MKLFRYGPAGQEKPGVLLKNGKMVDASPACSTYNGDFFSQDGFHTLEQWVEQAGDQAPEIPPDVRIGAPIERPGKIICIGLNYADHARESGMEPPAEPVLFFKATTSYCGPNDDCVIPPGSEKTDWEVELAVVVGKSLSRVSEAEAEAGIAGYMVMNDYSERAWQLERGGQWVKGKSADTFAPCGPYLVTPDEIPDVNDLNLWLEVNGERLQDGNTRELIFNIPHILSYLSQFMTLEPGDVISTGTPPGVGLGLNPPRYLKEGDVVRLGIDHLGEQQQTLVQG